MASVELRGIGVDIDSAPAPGLHEKRRHGGRGLTLGPKPLPRQVGHGHGIAESAMALLQCNAQVFRKGGQFVVCDRQAQRARIGKRVHDVERRRRARSIEKGGVEKAAVEGGVVGEKECTCACPFHEGLYRVHGRARARQHLVRDTGKLRNPGVERVSRHGEALKGVDLVMMEREPDGADFDDLVPLRRKARRLEVEGNEVG